MTQPNPYILSICNQIERKLGFRIKNIASAKSYSDSLAFQKLYVSSHTIARLFGVVKPFRTPYKETLNILANYLDYTNWEDFCDNQTNIPFDTNYFLTESSDGFSLAVLQSALVNEDLNSLKTIFKNVKNNESKAIIFSAAELIGLHVRTSKNQEVLLKFLAENSLGHLFFYECFVDEDNNDNYFYDALINYYLPKATNNYRLLFAYGYFISQKAYKEQIASEYISQFVEITKIISKEKCHFHEISRWLECLILIDGLTGILEDTWEQHINQILESFNFFKNDYEKAWVLVRPIKALIQFNCKHKLFNHLEFNTAVDYVIKNQRAGYYSVALYSIQLYWLCKETYFKSKVIYTPFRISNTLFQNESDEKLSVEFAIASLFATGDNKKIIDKNLDVFCKEKGTLWVLKLINE